MEKEKTSVWNRENVRENKRIADIIPMAAFLAILVFFMIWQIAAKDRSYSVSERRMLAHRPKLTFRSVRDASFMNSYETYLTDQFPMRDKWITLKTLCGMAIGQRESGGVYIAKDGSLIEMHSPDSVQGETGVRNETNLLAFVRNMKELGAEHVSVMLVPTADSVWKSKLSSYAEVFDQKAYLDALGEKLAREGYADALVDVWGELYSHAKEEIYYKTDHHWSMLGAYYGYRAYAEAIGESGVLSWDDYERETLRGDFRGTTAAKCGLYSTKDRIELIRPKNPSAKGFKVTYDMKTVTDSLYDYKQAAGNDPYSAYLDGNHPYTEIEALRDEMPETPRSLLILKDSYANCFVPYLTEIYDEIVMIDLRYYNASIRGLMEEKRFTDVLALYNLPNFLTEKTVYLLGR